MQASKVAAAGVANRQLLPCGEGGRRPARNRGLHALLELAANRINVHGELRQRTLELFGQVVALGGEKALELRARDRLGGVVERLAVAGGSDLEQLLELGHCEGVDGERLRVRAQLQHVPGRIRRFLLVEYHAEALLVPLQQLLLKRRPKWVLRLSLLKRRLGLKLLRDLKGFGRGLGRSHVGHEDEEGASFHLVGVRGYDGGGDAGGAQEVLEHASHDVFVVPLGLGEEVTGLVDGDHPLVAEERAPVGGARGLGLEGGGERVLRREEAGRARERSNRLAELLGRVGRPEPRPRRVVVLGQLPFERKEAVEDEVDGTARRIVDVGARVR